MLRASNWLGRGRDTPAAERRVAGASDDGGAVWRNPIGGVISLVATDLDVDGSLRVVLRQWAPAGDGRINQERLVEGSVCVRVGRLVS